MLVHANETDCMLSYVTVTAVYKHDDFLVAFVCLFFNCRLLHDNNFEELSVDLFTEFIKSILKSLLILAI